MTTVAIIGGGAAGMMVAATLAQRDDFSGTILLFEKNKQLGAKVLISGGGRCNITTSFYKTKQLRTYYTRGADFLLPAFKQFGPKKMRKRVEDHGVPTKCEDDGRIFPVSDNGHDVVGMFEEILIDGRVQLHLWESVESISLRQCSDGQCTGWYAISTNKQTYHVDKIVVTTGGNAYAHTGSSGDGYTFARSVGHTITKLWPSLNSFLTAEKRLHQLLWWALPNATLHYDTMQQSCTWPMLITHFGISGPTSFVLASRLAFEHFEKNIPYPIRLQIDADKDQLRRDQYLQECSHQSPQKSLQNTIISPHLTKRAAQVITQHMELSADMPIHKLNKQQRIALAELLGQWIPLHLIGRRPGDEFITAGGVDTEEIDPMSMESRICPWLFFAGEIMNVDGVTGWFNLQASRSTGYVAGMSI